MRSTIEIIREPNPLLQEPVYRAVQGAWQAVGKSAGEALDALEQMLTSQNGVQNGTLVVVQRFQPDTYFTAAQQARLQELMTQFHAADNTRVSFSADEQAELEQLVEEELKASTRRARGRVTSKQLRMNSSLQLAARRQWAKLGLFP